MWVKNMKASLYAWMVHQACGFMFKLLKREQEELKGSFTCYVCRCCNAFKEDVRGLKLLKCDAKSCNLVRDHLLKECICTIWVFHCKSARLLPCMFIDPFRLIQCTDPLTRSTAWCLVLGADEKNPNTYNWNANKLHICPLFVFFPEAFGSQNL